MRAASGLIASLFILAAGPSGAQSAPSDETLGLELYRAGHYAEAIPHLEAAAVARQQANLLIFLGDCYRKIHDYGKAEGAYQRILSTNQPADIAERARTLFENTTQEGIEWRRANPVQVPREAFLRKREVAPPPERSHTLAYVTTGAAVVCAAAGAMFGLQAKKATDAWKSDTSEPAWSTDRNTAQSAMTRANVAWIAAGALVVTSVVFFLEF